MSDLRQLYNRAAEASEALAAANLAVREALMAKWDIKVGDIVRYTGTRKTKHAPEYRVVHVGRVCEYSRPWVHGVFRKADGDWSSAERHLYGEWEKVS